MTTATATYTIRQSHLRHLEEHCPAMAYALNVEGRDIPGGPGAYRGTAVHDFYARYVDYLYRTGRETDWDAVPGIIAGVLAEYPGLSLEQHEDVAAQARNIANGLLFRRALYYGSEEPFETAITLPDGTECVVTGRIDHLEIDGETARITDAKSNHQILPDSRVRQDFQLKVYAMLVLDNLPNVEVAEGRLLLSRYGIMLPQKGAAQWTREDLEPLKEHLAYKLAAHFAGDLKGDRVPGVWCQYCPEKRPGRCTLHRSYYGTTPPPPLSEDQARRLARQVIALEEAREGRLALLKQYVNDNGPLPIGSGDQAEVFGFHVRESEEIAAGDVLRILEDNRDLIGTPDPSEIMTVNKRAKLYKSLRYHSDLRSQFDDVAKTSRSTTFGHKAIGGEDAA
jgi:hypothetical protein